MPPAAPATLPELSAQGIGIQAAVELLLGVVLPTAVPPDHPRYLAFIPGAPTVASAIADMALSAAMVYGGSRAEAGLAADAEDAVIRWLADVVGFPDSAGGTFVSGGSIATLSALVAARGERCASARRQVIVAGSSAHASVMAAARIMGCECVTAPPADAYGRLTPETLRVALDGRDPDDIVAVVATAGATNNGAVDDLAGLAALCQKRGIWLHVDGAYGGAALLAPRVRPLFAGIERADSFIVDPHKWLYAPFDCAAVLYRDAAVARPAHTQEADYLDWLSGTAGDNPSDLAIHLTRRIRGVPLWVSLQAYGWGAYAEAVECCFAIAAYAAEQVALHPRLELVLEPGAHCVARASLRLECSRLRRLVGTGAAAWPGLRGSHQARRRDRAALVFHQPADEPRRRRPRARRSGLTGPPKRPLHDRRPARSVCDAIVSYFAADTSPAISAAASSCIAGMACE